jgi:dolichyl-phosphate-mannose--protein O-mannosyl transferase
MPKLRRSTWIVLALVTLIVIAHVFLWRSDMPTGQKAMWTVLNTVTWTIILAPVFLVERWLGSVRARNGRPEDRQAGHGPGG